VIGIRPLQAEFYVVKVRGFFILLNLAKSTLIGIFDENSCDSLYGNTFKYKLRFEQVSL
jgi:hypothetical protein